MAQFAAIAKAILAILPILKTMWEYIQDHKVRKVEKRIKEQNQATDRLTVKIEAERAKEVPSDEAIRDLHRRLTAVSKL